MEQNFTIFIVFLNIIILGSMRDTPCIFIEQFLTLIFNVLLFPGWFSVISGNNTTGSARVYRRVDSLVKTGVPVFLLATPLRAYTLTHSKMGKL